MANQDEFMASETAKYIVSTLPVVSKTPIPLSPCFEGRKNRSDVWNHFTLEPSSEKKAKSAEVGSSPVVAKFDPKICRDEMVRMFIAMEIPLRQEEHPSFRCFLSVVQPKLDVMSRTTLALMNEVEKNEVEPYIATVEKNEVEPHAKENMEKAFDGNNSREGQCLQETM
ncbi:hypothetical protein SESBI_06995 [Sesbania bispinosa]|nr:hypothetical protein SESBI_06995 [Sesbania bispinosa]